MSETWVCCKSVEEKFSFVLDLWMIPDGENEIKKEVVFTAISVSFLVSQVHKKWTVPLYTHPGVG